MAQRAAVGDSGVEGAVIGVRYLLAALGNGAYLVGKEVAVLYRGFGCRDLFKSAVGICIVDRFAARTLDLCEVLALVVTVGRCFV